jgi:transposase-like protein
MMTSGKQTAGYPPEFRAEAIRLARTSGKPYRQIARDLGMTTADPAQMARDTPIWMKAHARMA